jgi:hypothetical protein
MAGVMGMVGVMPMVAVVLIVKMGMAHGFALKMYL